MAECRTSRARARTPTAAAQEPERDLSESPLAWLVRRKDKDGWPMLSDAEFDAGEKLRADFWFAQMTPRVTANWSMLLSAGGSQRGAPDLGPDVRDSVIAARERVRRALSAVGPDLAGVLIDVCCHLKGLEASEKASGWPQRSGKLFCASRWGSSRVTTACSAWRRMWTQGAGACPSLGCERLSSAKRTRPSLIRPPASSRRQRECASPSKPDRSSVAASNAL